MKHNSVLMTLVGAIAASCGTTATISRVNAGPVEARIAGRTADSLLVDTEFGARKEIPLSDIGSIDHPSAAAVVGAGITAYGALPLALGLSRCADGRYVDCVFFAIPASVGVPILLWGYRTWRSSKDKAATPEGVAVFPMVDPSTDRGFAGVAVGGDY